MNPVVSIDLGAAYTKIALRRKDSGVTELLAHDMLHLDEQHVCIPSVGAWNSRTNQWVFGVDAVDLQSGDGIFVYRNWKPLLFSHRGASFSQSEFATPTDAPSVQTMATEFFRWLRETFLPSTLGLPIEGTPAARICIPDFAVGTPAAATLESIIHEAGWCTRSSCCVSEPLASLTGAMSNGRNSIDLDESGDPFPVLSEIFGETEFANYWGSSSLGNTPYQVLVIDIGAYTADFGLVHLAAQCSDYFSLCKTSSQPLGILALDDMICEGLPDEKRTAIRNLSPTDRERMRQVVYSRGLPWRISNDMTLGMDAESKLVANCVESLAERIGDAVDQFLADQQVSDVHEVVLSGGGNGIPRIVSHLTQRLEQRHVLGIHLSETDGYYGSAHPFPISQQVVRGASAIGGASVLFDCRAA